MECRRPISIAMAALCAALISLWLPSTLVAQTTGAANAAQAALQATGPRVALIIGNGDYQHTTKLANPVNDATDVYNTLTALGFEAQLLTDATNAQMRQAVQTFADQAGRLRAETALFFYAGHAVQFEGINYLLPVNADIRNSFELADAALSMDRVSAGLEATRTGFNLIMLDACRDNPFASTRSASRGLTVMGGAAVGTMVVFATAPGSVALDGTTEERNSPFTKAFLQHVQTPDLEVSQLVREVQRSVQTLTGGAQTPWVNSSFTGEFFFATAEQQLALSRSQAAGLEQELAALEAEIARRAEQIAGEQDAEARRRLEADQQRARAQEEAKRLEAQQLAALREQAEEALAQRASQDALRREMEEQLQSQQVRLTAEAAARRAELEQLQRDSATRTGLLERLATIAQIQGALDAIVARFDETIASTLAEMDRLHQQNLENHAAANPRDPWETAAEHRSRLQQGLDALNTAHQRDRTARQQDLEQRRAAEIAQLQTDLQAARRELDGSRFALGADATRVAVGDFDAAAKRFPVTVASSDAQLTFQVPLYYLIDSRDREVLRQEYYRVFSADQAGGLAGVIDYSVHEVSTHLWAVRPTRAAVTNLLESDSVLVAGVAGTTRSVGGATATPVGATAATAAATAADQVVAPGGNDLLFTTHSGSVQPVTALVRFESTDSGLRVLRNGREEPTIEGGGVLYNGPPGPVRYQFRWNNGTTRTETIAVERGVNASLVVNRSGPITGSALMLVTGIPRDATLHVAGRGLRSEHSTQVVPLPAAGVNDIRIESPWLLQPVSIEVPAALRRAAVLWVDATPFAANPAGRLVARAPAGLVAVFDHSGAAVDASRGRGQQSIDIPLPPGEYQVAYRRADDSHYARVETVRVEAMQRTTPTVAQIEYSARHQLAQAQSTLELTTTQIATAGVDTTIGWSLLGSGVAGLVTGLLSYLQVESAIAAYNGATLTADLRAQRTQVEQWGTALTLSVSIGSVATTIGGIVLLTAPDSTTLRQERDATEQRIRSLQAQIDRQNAHSVVYTRSVR